MPRSLTQATCLLLALVFPLPALAEPLRIATFEADIIPPLGSPLCDGFVKPAQEIVDPLRARGIVLLTEGKPIVLCANRMLLAGRLALGMKEAYDSAKKVPVKAEDVGWRVTSVALPLSPRYHARDLQARVADAKLPALQRLLAAGDLIWARRCEAGDRIDLTCLRVGPAYVLHMPGELFVEYQLAAQKMKPGSPVMMAAYGDYGPGYIGTAIAYTQGGYETGPPSRVAPAVEEVLMRAMRELLK